MCEARDVKGLYKKAREGSIAGFTGVSQDYEAPQSPDLIVTTEGVSIRESTNRLIDLLERENVIPKNLRDIEVVSKSTEDENIFTFTLYALVFARFLNYSYFLTAKQR